MAHDDRVRPLGGQRERDAAAARADVDHTRRVACRAAARGAASTRSSVSGRGMSTSGVDHELVAPEGLGAGQVLQRAAARRARPRGRGSAASSPAGSASPPRARMRGAVPAQDVAQQQLGVQRRVIDAAARAGARRRGRAPRSTVTRPSDRLLAASPPGGGRPGRCTISSRSPSSTSCRRCRVRPMRWSVTPRLREVVGADLLAAVAAAHLALAVAARSPSAAPRGPPRRAARAGPSCAFSRFLIWLFSSWQETTVLVGRWVMRTAE